ncbi:MAG: hypothetical protein IT303_18475 [Dehalococcoidia bacterium]|nr:hypothetical protein [Dehalococcoidia bacterium]
MDTTASFETGWGRKRAEGKMFQRFECESCQCRYNFADSPRVTRVPRCPICGSFNGRLIAA